MKVAFIFFTVVAAIASAAVDAQVNAQPAGGCAQIVQNINNVVALIDQNATVYWEHRANFVDLIYGPSSQVVPNAMQVAEQEKSQADTVKAGMPGRVNSLQGLLRAAQAQGCLSPAQLSTVGEPSIKHGKRVNFDQFPDELPESVVGPGPRRMPQ
jgi:hypothetical protein